MRRISVLVAVFSAVIAIRCAGPTLPDEGEPKVVPKRAYFMRLADNWDIDGLLPTQAMLISLQGLANQDTPRLYFEYPDNWPYKFTRALRRYYEETRGIQFIELATPEQALEKLALHARGCVVWDRQVRTSLIVAFTAAGLHQAIVVDESLLPLAEKYGLPIVEDLRGKFRGKTDYEIYSWAYERFWPQCSRQYLVYMGGVAGNRMQPGIADFGIYKRAFFTDLSADPSDTLEYQLAKKIMSEMQQMGMVMGWHSYAKDTEGQHVTLVSSMGLRMEGLNTLPNMSFNCHIPTTEGYRYRNNHHVQAGQKLVPEKKVYVACIQTDCLGIGAWLRPGRGQIPYAWEVTMNWSWLAPAMLQFFYDMATPNDYFIGSLSGPGYMYPKAIPPDVLPKMIRRARELMHDLDLRVFETMDYSEGNRFVGNIDLPKRIVDAYFEGMPDAIGFVNGYGPANTYAYRDGRVFYSYQYYLSPTRPEEEAASDIIEIANLNPKRPYFLLIHVRESSDVQRVKNILDRLGPEFEVVPLDVFLTLAAHEPAFEERYMKAH